MTNITTIKTSDDTTIKYTKDGITEYANPGVGAITAGILIGNMANAIASKAVCGAICNKIFQKMQGVSLSPEESDSIFSAAKKALTQSGLQSKGTEIVIAGENSVTDWHPNVKNPIIKNYKNNQIKVAENVVKEGKNAYFVPGANKILLPPRGKGFSGLGTFHEIGHAMNFNIGKVGKFLQKARCLSILALPISLIALYKTNAPDDESKGVVDKTTTFIKQNAGKLTFASLMPVVAEEGLATIKGNKLAKNLLNPSLLRKTQKLTGLAFFTYLSLAICSSLGVALAVKIKDKIASKEIIDYNKHFDIDKNGKIDDSEKEAKEKYINGRKAEQKKLFEQFDINKNGQIDPEEASAMEAFLCEG